MARVWIGRGVDRGKSQGGRLGMGLGLGLGLGWKACFSSSGTPRSPIRPMNSWRGQVRAARMVGVRAWWRGALVLIRVRVRVRVRVTVRLREWLDQFTWARQAQYMVHSSRSSFSSCHNIISISRLDFYYSGAINRLKSSLRGT